ncbi:TonB-dependent receptor [Paucibacter sp. DJ1R-11]|uniref:TonB-dependent receptor n=1 Tax=Paucibacter sp. DJ1R-11 TaxID=2893556 RepID=UPI0021E46CCC|nr:TonB-dependent receptor [Paucibacter sp. DJ1R-11]MCV2365107.1 TonB-dependent receptor [Paucibacter sp. DJ1R-11]
MRNPRPVTRLSRSASAVGLLVASLAAHAQQASNPPADANKAQLDAVVVTGIRQSLESSLNLKRNARGLVDGIVAEDIGKFPDTNLAESMQRIAGVSIDRSLGEGSKITVRGVGPDFNLVLLNGRQMPASSLGATFASNSRSFDFANLASEGVAALEVYKTSRADSPTGGIGATINIKTARPLDNKQRVASVGVKMVSDESNKRLPDSLNGSQMTPEVSGIYSDVSADGRFGIALIGSIQKRNGGYNQAAVDAGWRTFKGDEQNWGTIPLPGQAGADKITNRPKPTDLYVVPQEMRYSLNSFERTRTNGQLVLQFRPVQDVTTTFDHTYSENKIHSKRSELSAWFNFGPSSSSWTNGPIAAPLTYTETYDPKAPADVAMAGSIYGTKNKNQSTGMNVAWKASNALTLELDAHHSTATSGADSPFGSNSTLGVSMYNRASASADFSQKFPVLSIGLAGDPAASPSLLQVTGSSFRNSYMRNQIDQAQFKGKYVLNESSGLDFGIGMSKVKNRTAFANVQQDDWGGHNKPSDYPDNLFQAGQLQNYFAHSMGSNGGNLFNNFYLWDFQAVRAAAIKADGSDKWFVPSSNFTDDRRTQEKSSSAYLQYGKDWVWGVPMSANIGLRYERTKVDSQALVPIVTGINWVSANEFALVRGASDFTALSGSYKYLLPSIDWEAELSDKVKVRASYGETIGRPGWGAIQGGVTLSDFRVNGGSGSQGNPGLKPLLSKNFDLSAEYYYAKSSYAALGLFRKNISNFIGSSTLQSTPAGLTSPIGGALYNEAVTKSCPTKDASCIRTYILNTYNGTKGVVRTGFDGNGNPLGTISGQTGDPVAAFTITAPTNQRSDSIKGMELNLQHAFGKTGFGVAANYTWVKSGLKYDNLNLTEQNALLGMSNSSNLVGFYEDDKYSARVAYNWRDEFLSSTSADVFGSAGPAYTEAYGQWDLSLGYKFSKKLSVNFEALNLNDGIQRVHGRAKEETLYFTQTGRRYMLSARYAF